MKEHFARTIPNDVYGSLPLVGKPKTLGEMHSGIGAEVKRRHEMDIRDISTQYRRQALGPVDELNSAAAPGGRPSRV